MGKADRYRGFRKLSTATLITVFVLILAGGIVRSTGSGMGCPDWPKCFGRLVPPTSIAQLPADYKAYYASYRQEKNERFARYLEALGMGQKADRIRTDESILVEADFNVFKTWTEFINRLIGALTGLLILVMMLYSFRLAAYDRVITALSVTTFLLVLFQGWIGSVVVSTNLLPWTVTLHMLIALVIVVLLVVIVMRANRDKVSATPIRKRRLVLLLCVICLMAMGTQILMGTQVREAVDTAAAALSFDLRHAWIAQTGRVFLTHRTFSLVLLALNAGLAFMLFKTTQRPNKLRVSAVVLMGLLVVEIGLGMVLAYAGLPPVAQPGHLLISMLMFGLLVAIFVMIRKSVPPSTVGIQQ